MEVLGNHSGQLVFDWIDPLGQLAQEIEDVARSKPAIDFESFKNRAGLDKTA